MNKEFKELYDKWNEATMFLSYRDLEQEQGFIDLVNWSKENKEEAVDSIEEILKNEPDFVVYVLDELYDHPLATEGYVSIEQYCNVWLNILDYYKNGEKDLSKVNFSKDNYKDYKAYMEYMDDNYIPWNPFTGDGDPNVTFEEYKMGKRNNPNFNRPIQMVKLKDEDFKRETTRE